MILNFIWNVSPRIFSIGPFQFQWIVFLLAAAILLGRKWLFILYKQKGETLQEAKQVFNYIIVGGILGARLFYVFFIEPRLFSKPLQILIPFEWSHGLKFIAVGQFSMIGALFGIILSLWIYARLNKKHWLIHLDKALLIFGVILIFLRLGNFFQSEYYGKPTDAPQGILFVNPIERELLQVPCCAMRNPNGENPLDTVSIKPGLNIIHDSIGFKPLIIYLFFKDGATEQLVNEFLIGDVKTYLYDKSDLIYEPGTEPLHYTIFVEGKDNNYMARIQTTGVARHPLQLYEALAFLVVLIMMYLLTKKRPDMNHGMLAGIYILLIGFIHFIMEFLSELPRPMIKQVPLNGDQLLCIPLILLGLIIVLQTLKRKKNPTSQ